VKPTPSDAPAQVLVIKMPTACGTLIRVEKNNVGVRKYSDVTASISPVKRGHPQRAVPVLLSLLNYFLSAMNLIEKVRASSKARKVYEKFPRIPAKDCLNLQIFPAKSWWN
jgi:hypothetical protein